MKTKSTLVFYSFFLSCCFSLLINAQEQRSNNDFTLNVIQYSGKPNYEKEHIHILELKNNSQLVSQYSVSIINNQCSDNHQNKLSNKKESNINTEIYLKNLSRKHENGNIISLDPNESIKVKLKTYQKNNAVLGSLNCTSIQATKLSQNESKGLRKNISESITIKTYVPDPANLGH